MALNIVKKIDDLVKVNHVLASVSDKNGLDHLIPGLVQINPDIMIYSTGGTYKRIRDILGEDNASRNLTSVSEYTGQPEMQGGLVKTLDFKIYLGLLSETYNEMHVKDLQRVDAVPINMVVVNLYPFKETIAKPDVTPEQARTHIDIGGVKIGMIWTGRQHSWVFVSPSTLGSRSTKHCRVLFPEARLH